MPKLRRGDRGVRFPPSFALCALFGARAAVQCRSPLWARGRRSQPGEERAREGKRAPRAGPVPTTGQVRRADFPRPGFEAEFCRRRSGGEAAAAGLEKEEPQAARVPAPGPRVRGQVSGSCPRPVWQGLPLAREPSQRPRRRKASGLRRETFFQAWKPPDIVLAKLSPSAWSGADGWVFRSLKVAQGDYL